MKWSLFIGLLCGVIALQAQPSEAIIQDFLQREQSRLDLTASDIINWTISSQHRSKQSGVQHIYIQQTHQGLPVYNAVANFAIKDNKVWSMGNRLISDVARRINTVSPVLSPTAAIQRAAAALDLPTPEGLRVLEAQSTTFFQYNKGGISLENIPVRLSYVQIEDGALRLVWDLSIYQLDAQHWWSARVDALTGQLLDVNDWVIHCAFDGLPQGQCSHSISTTQASAPETIQAPSQYHVFALPTESPSHDSRSFVTNPADSLASPFGWHDINGAAGAEYTITRGNNVHAYEDTSNNNAPGYSPDGGSVLEFNFSYIPGSAPRSFLNTAITNLFYMNNTIHDVWYQYGFDEASGNFQRNNYGRGGTANDEVQAEAQDGSGTSNANFATPPEGNRPRMQMYIWPFNTTTAHFLSITAPSNIASTYLAAKANFGPILPAIPIVGNIVDLEDAIMPTADGCDSVVNATMLQGNIVLVDQGTCSFTEKVQAAQDAGARAVIVRAAFGFIFAMGGTSSTITIPSIMVLPTTADAIRAELQTGTPVIAEISNAGINDKDSDLDNGIIIHEYGHGISTRLTGGAFASNCLRNAEQMGEGWSDWFGLMMTIEPGDQGRDIRGIGTYVRGELNNGPGIRPAPYSTDFNVNNYTYAASNWSSISQPHGVGFIFATVLWDLNWALIDQYGGTPDPDLYNGAGGNNIAMQLVIEGLKLQPCSPGMIDGRDAILQADQLLYNGAHQCLIWEVFARRGFGYSASQGSNESRTDQIEAFDLSPACFAATAPPVAAFEPSALNSCVATLMFQDSSYSTPHQWFWDFDDGSTSTQQNPTHTYRNDGVYNVRLIVTNNLGSDTAHQQITIRLPPPPIVADVEVCAGDTALLIASGTGTIQWKNAIQRIISRGDTLVVPHTGSTSTFYAENLTGGTAQTVGIPLVTSAGQIYYNSIHEGLNFYAEREMDLLSVDVYAAEDTTRTFVLSRGQNISGLAPTDTVQTYSVFIPVGIHTVSLPFTIPDTGWYNLGGQNLNLLETTSGIAYPYTIPGLIRITSHTGNSGTTYPFFHNIQVREKPCISADEEVQVFPVTSAFTFSNIGTTFTFTDHSADAVSWFWDFGDGFTSTLQNPVHTYANNTPRTVTLTINGGSCSSAQMINGIISVYEPKWIAPRFFVQPNPASHQVQLELSRALDEDLTVQLYDVQGRVLKTVRWERGTANRLLSLEGLTSGLYYIRLQGLQFMEVRKIRVEP